MSTMCKVSHTVFKGNSCAITRDDTHDWMMRIVCFIGHMIVLKELCTMMKNIAHISMKCRYVMFSMVGYNQPGAIFAVSHST